MPLKYQCQVFVVVFFLKSLTCMLKRIMKVIRIQCYTSCFDIPDFGPWVNNQSQSEIELGLDHVNDSFLDLDNAVSHFSIFPHHPD